MSLNNFGRCNRSSDLLGTRRLVLKSRKQVDLFFSQSTSSLFRLRKKVLWKKTDKKKILPVESFLIKSIFKYLRTKDMHWYHQSLTRPRENNKIFRIMKKSEDSYKLNMIWNMIEVKIAAITVRRCAKCLEFLAGKRKTRLKWLSVSKTAQ